MKYVILCGGEDTNMGRQLRIVNGERLIERTIRLLQKNTTDEIIITANNDMFRNLGVRVITDYNNTYKSRNNWRNYDVGHWVDGFVLFDEPVTYLFGDRYYSDEAIETIVNDDMGFVTFFGTDISKWSDDSYRITRKDCILAIKVTSIKVWKDTIAKAKDLYIKGEVPTMPKCFTLYRIIHMYPLDRNIVGGAHYITINDESTFIDSDADIGFCKMITNKLGKRFDTNVQPTTPQPVTNNLNSMMSNYDPFKRNRY